MVKSYSIRPFILIALIFGITNALTPVQQDYSRSNPSDNDVHLKAGIALTKYLISKERAKSDQGPVVVTMIDFNDDANVNYELGDPSEAATRYSGLPRLHGDQNPKDVLPPDQDRRITDVAISTSGLSVDFGSATETANFVVAMASNGLTKADKAHKAGLTTLVSKLRLSHELKEDESGNFGHAVLAGETIILIVSTVDTFTLLRFAVRREPRDIDLKSA
ncbi:hypothetical protein CC78DRAFT_586663 [Lojkania enalia]|uniref:Uncharacterized protein n=1 Tax=Lojkania enalia TaxID=147567 RepID=A0A9P4K019_9PLEO|nr:hypothetical protein CC78DRAFT_586663 [Didymosphaeria enalia]